MAQDATGHVQVTLREEHADANRSNDCRVDAGVCRRRTRARADATSGDDISTDAAGTNASSRCAGADARTWSRRWWTRPRRNRDHDAYRALGARRRDPAEVHAGWWRGLACTELERSTRDRRQLRADRSRRVRRRKPRD